MTDKRIIVSVADMTMLLFRDKEVVKIRYVSDARARTSPGGTSRRVSRIFLASESIVNVTMVDGVWRREKFALRERTGGYLSDG